MTTYVAFLRAINLGATRKFPKEAITAASEAAGFTDVATHINTGNVRIGTRMRSRSRVEEALEKAYEADRGFVVPTIVFTDVELRQIAADADELAADHDGKHYVSLLKDEPSARARRTMEDFSTSDERVHVRGRAVHLLAPSYLESQAVGKVEKVLGVATNRNVTVIRALAQKWC